MPIPLLSTSFEGVAVFHLHPRLEADTHLIANLTLCQLRLMNDARFPWSVLVPQRSDLVGVHELTPHDQKQLIEESSLVSRLFSRLYQPDRINVGALGNLVPQLHWHVVARHSQDPCWPGPVWGCGETRPYETVELEARLQQIATALAEEEHQ